MRKLNLHWFCTQNHILEPFSVRRACTQCYVTSEPYPRPSQIWCQNVRETRKKIVIKCRDESFARCRVIARYVEGGAIMAPPSLIRVNPIPTRLFESKFQLGGGGGVSIYVFYCFMISAGWDLHLDVHHTQSTTNDGKCYNAIKLEIVSSSIYQKFSDRIPF